MILAGDVGGTKCNLALYEVHGQDYRKVVQHRYESREFSSFDEIIKKFLIRNLERNEECRRRRRSKRRVLAWPAR